MIVAAGDGTITANGPMSEPVGIAGSYGTVGSLGTIATGPAGSYTASWASVSYLAQAAVAVDEPQVLIGSDMRQVPHKRAHEGGEDPAQLVIAEMADERERPLSGGVKRRQRLLRTCWEGVSGSDGVAGSDHGHSYACVL